MSKLQFGCVKNHRIWRAKLEHPESILSFMNSTDLPRKKLPSLKKAIARKPASPQRPATSRRFRAADRAWLATLRPGIERDTELMPWLIADSVMTEAQTLLGADLPAEWSDWLDARAERLYRQHAQFRRLVRGAGQRGRDALYRFLRHWLASRITRERRSLARRLPHDFVMGLPAYR